MFETDHLALVDGLLVSGDELLGELALFGFFEGNHWLGFLADLRLVPAHHRPLKLGLSPGGAPGRSLGRQHGQKQG